jgi:hypothetical protein
MQNEIEFSCADSRKLSTDGNQHGASKFVEASAPFDAQLDNQHFNKCLRGWRRDFPQMQGAD